MRVPLPILGETVSVMKLVPYEHEQLKKKTIGLFQPQFINKVRDNRVKVERQVPQSKWEMRRSSQDVTEFSSATKWRISLVQQI